METNNIKGALHGLCNRSACLAPGANWYNHSTREHYCESCAILLNFRNRKDAWEMFGHDLCTIVDGSPHDVADVPLSPFMQEVKEYPFVNPYPGGRIKITQQKKCIGRHQYTEHVKDNAGAVLEISYICKCGKVLGEN